MSGARDVGVDRDAVAGPGVDTRGWCHIGLVEAETADQHSVLFDDADGNPNPVGPQVLVRLMPHGDVLPCRVSSQCTGPGEAEWHPLVGGDEVVVLVPNGDEKNGGVVVGRLSQSLDYFPRVVGGEDVTKNAVAFERLTAPYVLESGTAIKLTCANTGANITIDPQGRILATDGSLNSLLMTPDGVSLQLADLAAGFQLDPSKTQATVLAGGTSFVVDDQQSKFETAGQLSLNTGGATAANHAVSIEAVVALFQGFVDALVLACGVGVTPLTGTALGALLLAALGAPEYTGLAAAVTAAVGAPPTPLVAAAIQAGLSIPKSFPEPGIGSPGTLID